MAVAQGVVAYALKAPAHVGVHELLIEPRDQMWGDPTSLAVKP
jgi:NADP-dependent 3-hydroxy acid dehydrogenase YdfG